MSRNQRGTTDPSVSHNRYKTNPDGRGATEVARAEPVGKDPLAVETGKNDTAAQLEYLASKRGR